VNIVSDAFTRLPQWGLKFMIVVFLWGIGEMRSAALIFNGSSGRMAALAFGLLASAHVLLKCSDLDLI